MAEQLVSHSSLFTPQKPSSHGLKNLSPELIQWLLQTLSSEHNEEELVKTLISKKCDPYFAKEAVKQAKHGIAHPQELEEIIQNLDFAYEPGFGYANTVKTSDKDVDVLLSIKNPEVYLFGNFLSAAECEELIQLSRYKLKRSTTVDPKTGQHYVEKDRTSRGTFFEIRENPLVVKLDKRISEIMQLPVENGEGIQILNYSVGAEYKPHFDYFPPQDPGSMKHILKGGQRVSTLIMYLNTVEGGGETSFPELGLEVAPKQGSAVYFAYHNSRGQLDRMSLHAGKPVLKGEKWIATKWMREGRYN